MTQCLFSVLLFIAVTLQQGIIIMASSSFFFFFRAMLAASLWMTLSVSPPFKAKIKSTTIRKIAMKLDVDIHDAQWMNTNN